MISVESLKSHMKYDPETGMFTRTVSTSNRSKIGVELTAKNALGYIVIGLFGNRYYAHRLAWMYMTGTFPEGQVDHINQDKSDNRWINLRCATPSQNKVNQPAHRDSRSGVKGVSWNQARSKWVARCALDGKQRTLGYFSDIESASEAYTSFVKTKHPSFVCFGDGA